MVMVYVRATEKAVLVCSIESRSELSSCLQKLSWPFLQMVIHGRQGLNLPWGEEAKVEVADMIEYAKKNKKEFWCIAEKQWDQKGLNQKAPSLHTIEAVWLEFNQAR